MNEAVLLALFAKLVDEKLAKLPEPIPGPKGRRGPAGLRGEDGSSFDFKAHEPQIRAWAEEFALTFDKLSGEQIEALRGPQGKPGPSGRSFDFAEHESAISSIIVTAVENLRPELKLKFEDLTEDDRMSLRGSRGQRGKPGKDFIFEEHRGYFDSLRLKFSDLTDEEVESLKLKFSALTLEERESLKLKFDDLTDDDRAMLRGSRGQRGKVGVQGEAGPKGEIGERGPQGIRGSPGPIGTRGLVGLQGADGEDGEDGQDAPVITSIDVDQNRDEFSLQFNFSNGEQLETPTVKLPASRTVFMEAGGGYPQGGGGGSGSGTVGPQGPAGATGANGSNGIDGESAYQIWLDLGNTGTEADFIASLKGAKGDKGDTGATGASGSGGSGAGQIIYNVPCDSTVYSGAAVRMGETNVTPSKMNEWTSLRGVMTLNYNDYTSVAVNAMADNYIDSNVIGIVEDMPTSTTCDIRISGVSAANYISLNVTDDYYLSDTIPGGIVPSSFAPTASGSVLVRIGQPVSQTSLLFQRGDRLVRV